MAVETVPKIPGLYKVGTKAQGRPIPRPPVPILQPRMGRGLPRETEHELPDFSSMFLAVGGGARQGFKLVDLVVFYHRISADYPTGNIDFFGHGILLG